MSAPPLAAQLLDLIGEAQRMALQADLNATEEKAALAILGAVVGRGETSASRALREVAYVIERDRDRLLQVAIDLERQSRDASLAAAQRRVGIGAKSARRGRGGRKKKSTDDPLQARWDLDR